MGRWSVHVRKDSKRARGAYHERTTGLARRIIQRVKVGDIIVALIDIEKSINTALKTNFPNVKLRDNDTKEGFKRPCFFTQIIPITTEYETINFTSNKLMIVINYFNENGAELENIKMYDELKKTFGMTLKVNQRSFLLKNIRSEIVDKTLQFKFDLDYFTNIEKIDNHEIMRELDTEMINIEN